MEFSLGSCSCPSLRLPFRGGRRTPAGYPYRGNQDQILPPPVPGGAGSLLWPSPLGTPSVPSSWERDRRVGEAFGVPASPLSEHQPVSGNPHISRRECISRGLKIGHCSHSVDSVGGREQKGRGWGWAPMEPPFVLRIHAFAENSWVPLMREAAQMAKWAASPFLG